MISQSSRGRVAENMHMCREAEEKEDVLRELGATHVIESVPATASALASLVDSVHLIGTYHANSSTPTAVNSTQHITPTAHIPQSLLNSLQFDVNSTHTPTVTPREPVARSTGRLRVSKGICAAALSHARV